MKHFLTVSVVVLLGQAAFGDVVISEWMYSGANGEFIEFTNAGSEAVDMTNWSYSDTDAQPGDLSFLDVFGVVQPGESVILTDADPTAFRTAWGLDAGVKVFGSNTNSNLGRNDQINLYDAAGNQVDQLIFGDQVYPGTVRTQNKSCSILASRYGYTVVQEGWVLASIGDAFGSWASSGGDLGSPGLAIPEPATLVLVALGGLAIARRR